MNRKIILIVAVFVVAAVFIVFPTPHVYTKQEEYLVPQEISKSFDCNQTLAGAQSLHWNFSVVGNQDIHFDTWVQVYNSSRTSDPIPATEIVSLQLLTGQSYMGGKPYYETMYNRTDRTVGWLGTRSYSRSGGALDTTIYYKVILTNPNAMVPITLRGRLRINGSGESLKAYRSIQYTQWAPWWMP